MENNKNENLNEQQQHWENTFTSNPEMFGDKPSKAAVHALNIFKKTGATQILELGAGQGRDTLFFAQNGLHVYVLDYTREGTTTIRQKAASYGLNKYVTVIQHDVRETFPLSDDIFDGCFSHLLYCMAFTTSQLHKLNQEVRRILRPGGFNIYTVRHTGDSHYGKGIYHDEDMYEVGGFIVHFFCENKVKKLSDGYRIVTVDELEEGGLPRKLFQVTLEKYTND